MDRLRKVLNIALLEEQESDVGGLAIAILSMAEKDFLHGYMVRPEHHIVGGIADITVEVMKNGDKVLVIECKQNPSLSTRGETRLKGTMAHGYPNGLLLCGQLSRFYSMDVSDPTSTPRMDQTLSNPIQIEDVVEIIKGM